MAYTCSICAVVLSKYSEHDVEKISSYFEIQNYVLRKKLVTLCDFKKKTCSLTFAKTLTGEVDWY